MAKARKTELGVEHAERLFGQKVPVTADAVELRTISSAIMKRTWEIMREVYPDVDKIDRNDKNYKANFSSASTIAADQLAPFVYNSETGKPMADGAELKGWRSLALRNIQRKKPVRRPRREVKKYVINDEPPIFEKKKVKTEVRVPPPNRTKEKTPKVYNQRQVNRCAEILMNIADKHSWIPPDSMVSLLTGYPHVNCRLARERLYDRGYYLTESRNGAWRVVARPDQRRKAPANGLYTAEEVAALLEKVRNGEI